MTDDDTPAWPHHQRPPDSADRSRPMTYVTEMCVVGVMLSTGADAVTLAVEQGLSPAEFIAQIKRGGMR